MRLLTNTVLQMAVDGSNNVPRAAFARNEQYAITAHHTNL
jgi:hypothetical protein